MSTVNFRTLRESLELAHGIPHHDLIRIMSKPDVSDRAADQRWRRLCEKYNVDTCADGISGDRKIYLRSKYLERRCEELEARVKEMGEEASRLRTEMARMRIEAQRG